MALRDELVWSKTNKQTNQPWSTFKAYNSWTAHPQCDNAYSNCQFNVGLSPCSCAYHSERYSFNCFQGTNEAKAVMVAFVSTASMLHLYLMPLQQAQLLNH